MFLRGSDPFPPKTLGAKGIQIAVISDLGASWMRGIWPLALIPAIDICFAALGCPRCHALRSTSLMRVAMVAFTLFSMGSLRVFA
jgi:hypothetical protein